MTASLARLVRRFSPALTVAQASQLALIWLGVALASAATSFLGLALLVG